jgi:hypothetical protein
MTRERRLTVEEGLIVAEPWLLGPVLDKPKIFKHNEHVSRRWYAWVCRFCGIVKLEDAPGPDEWTCEICRVRGLNSNLIPKIKEDKK